MYAPESGMKNKYDRQLEKAPASYEAGAYAFRAFHPAPCFSVMLPGPVGLGRIGSLAAAGTVPVLP